MRPNFNDPIYLKQNKDKYIKYTYDTYTTYTPNYLFQVYHKIDKIPKEVYENIAQYAPNYEHIVMDDKMIEQFLQTYYTPIVFETFRKIKNGAHKADLARYCLLYIYGGVYLDIKTELVKPLDDVFKYNSDLYTVIASSSLNPHIYQGIIKTKKEHPLFLSLIDFIVHHPSLLPYIEYHSYCKDFYYQISNDLNVYNIYDKNNKIKEGLNVGKSSNYYLLKEKCSYTDCSMCYDGFDRYGVCCFVWDGEEPVIKSRRSSYPW